MRPSLLFGQGMVGEDFFVLKYLKSMKTEGVKKANKAKR